MKIIARPRQSGKTTELIKMSAETGYIMAVPNIENKIWVMEKAKEMGLNIPEPFTHDQFIDLDYEDEGIKGFLIDNAEYLLKKLTDVPIRAIVIDYPLDPGVQTN